MRISPRIPKARLKITARPVLPLSRPHLRFYRSGNHVTRPRVISPEEPVHHVAIARREVFTCNISRFRVLPRLRGVAGCRRLAAHSKVAAFSSSSLLLPIHPTFSPTPTPALAGARGYQTLKEGATGPRRSTHIHAPGKHKHHACRGLHGGKCILVVESTRSGRDHGEKV